MGKLKQSLIDTDQEDQSSDNEPAFYSAEEERSIKEAFTKLESGVKK